LSIRTKKKVHCAYICNLDSLATLKLQMVAAFKPWEEEKIKFVKKQAKKVKVSPKGKNGYGKFTEMQVWLACRKKTVIVLPGGIGLEAVLRVIEKQT